MIKTPHKQTGSTHVVIIIIVIIALLGAVGFVFWNSMSQKASGTTNVTPASVTNSNEPEQAASPVKDTSKDYLDLQNWKVKFKLPSESAQITYYQILTNADGLARGFDGHHYEFSTKEVESLEENCVESGDGGGVTRLASLSRSKEKISTQGAILIGDGQPVGGYYYYLEGAQSTCSSNDTAMQVRDRGALVDILRYPIAY